MELAEYDNRYRDWILRQGSRLALNYARNVAPDVVKYAKRQASDWWNKPTAKRQTLSTPQSKMARSQLVGGGVYGGRFRKPTRKIPRTPKGISARFQTGSEIQADLATGETNVIFASTPHIPGNTMTYFWLAVLKKLARLAGQDFVNENQQIDELLAPSGVDFSASFVYTFTLGAEPDLFERTVNVGPDATWKAFAGTIASDIVGFFVGNAVVNWKKAVLVNRSKITFSDQTKTHAINLADTYVDLTIREVLKIQNRTPADAPTGFLAEDIRSNPLVGRVYVVKKPWVNLRFDADENVTPTWAPSAATGMLQIKTEEASYSPEIRALLQSIPSPAMLTNIKSSGIVRLQPGHIKSHPLSYNLKGKFDKAFEQLYYDYAVGVSNKARWAPMQIFAFEKTMRTGTGTAAVTVGYEKTVYFNMGITVRNSKGFIPNTIAI